MAAVCLMVLLGTTALAVDVGFLWSAQRTMQTAADAGALNGAAELIAGDWKAGAYAGTALNGVSNGVNGASVIVNNPPLSGAYAGNSQYVEVIASQSEPTFIMRFFGHPSINVSARAVAENSPTTDCIITLGSDQTNQTSPPGATGAGIAGSGSSSLSAPNCGITDNADASGGSAVSLSGSGSITAKSLATAGTVAASDLSQITVTNPSTVTTGITPVSDPLAHTVTAPANPGGCSSLSANGGTIGPSGGGTICYSSLTIEGTVTLNPGVYYIQGNLTIQGGAVVTGSGVTFYVTCPPGDCTSASTENCQYACITVSSSTLNVSAPTSASSPYNGILFYQNASDPETATIQGGSSGTINGIFYFPTAGLNLSSSDATFNVDLVVSWLDLTGPSVINEYKPLDVPSSVPSPVLVE